MTTALATTTAPLTPAVAVRGAMASQFVRDVPESNLWLSTTLAVLCETYIRTPKTEPEAYIGAADALMLAYPNIRKDELSTAFLLLTARKLNVRTEYYGQIDAGQIVDIMAAYYASELVKAAKEGEYEPLTPDEEETNARLQAEYLAQLARWEAGEELPERWGQLIATECMWLVRNDPRFEPFKLEAWATAKVLTDTEMSEAHEGAVFFQKWGMEKKVLAMQGASPQAGCYAKICVWNYLQSLLP